MDYTSKTLTKCILLSFWLSLLQPGNAWSCPSSALTEELNALKALENIAFF